jgi:potassium-transporting ATPase KdpC subunit
VIRHQLRPAIAALVVFTALTGVAYPLAVTGVAQSLLGHRADGSRIVVDGELHGSELIAQPFEGDEWFHPRPSAVGYDASSSGGSNLGPTNPRLLADLEARTRDYRRATGIADGVPVPVDAVTTSGSGLDPHISPRNARLQAPRVAAARDLGVDEVLALVDRHTERRTGAVLGEPRVNVVRLNLALARLQG